MTLLHMVGRHDDLGQDTDAIIRIGRKMIEVMSVLDMLIKKGCKVHAVKGGYRLDQSLSSKILSMVLLMAAEVERELTSQHEN